MFDTSLAEIDADTLKRFTKSIVPGGLVLGAEPLPHPLTDLIMGVGSSWWDEGATAEFPISKQQADWTKALETAGLTDVQTVPLKSALIEADLICARAGERAEEALSLIHI